MKPVEAYGLLRGDIDIVATVLNPGDWFGKTWLLEIGGSFTPLFLCVEADSASDAIDVLADDEAYGHNIVIAPEDMGDYDEETVARAGNSGQPVDLDWLSIHGAEGLRNGQQPWPCKLPSRIVPARGDRPNVR
jgi:hypothetical protein